MIGFWLVLWVWESWLVTVIIKQIHGDDEYPWPLTQHPTERWAKILMCTAGLPVVIGAITLKLIRGANKHAWESETGKKLGAWLREK